MKLPTSPFTVTDWSKVEPTVHPGETGQAQWRTLDIGDLRVRMVEYSPGYLATIGATAATCCTCCRASSTASCATAASSSSRRG